MVEMGSSAEVGSSISSTSGSTASARAMHSRCCWPPERPSARLFQPVLDLVPDGRAPQGLFYDLIKLRLVVDAVGPGTVGNVVINAHGEGIWLLEHHAHPLAQLDSRPCPARKYPRRPDGSCRSIRQPSTRSFIRFRVWSSVDLPQPDGPMNAVMSCCLDLQVDVLERLEIPVIEVKVLDMSNLSILVHPCS